MAYSEPCPTSNVEHFMPISTNCSTLDVWQGSQYASVNPNNNQNWYPLKVAQYLLCLIVLIELDVRKKIKLRYPFTMGFVRHAHVYLDPCLDRVANVESSLKLTNWGVLNQDGTLEIFSLLFDYAVLVKLWKSVILMKKIRSFWCLTVDMWYVDM